MSNAAVEVVEVSKRFRLYKERNQSLKAALMRGGRARYDEFWALKDVSFEVPEGSTFALIGENGSGKSTLLKCIARILEPEKGAIRARGSMAALLELGSGFHPELSGRENIFLNGSILGLSKRELERKFDEIVDFAGVERFIDQPVKNYSSGMYMRLGFSVAINVDPDVLLVDEVLAVGDASFQEKCLAKFADFRRAGKTVIIVSHAMGSMRTLCDQAAWLDHGTLVEVGRADHIVDRYSGIAPSDPDADEAPEQPQPDKAPAEAAVEDVALQETPAGPDETAPAPAAEEVRFGSGEARLTGVRLLDRSGEPATAFRTGDAVTVRLDYECSSPVEGPVFGLMMENLDGICVWSQSSRDAEVELAVIDGQGYIDIEIPRLTLQPHTFDLTASVVDHTMTHPYDVRRRCYRFVVEAPPGRPRESGGVAALGGRWNAEHADVTRGALTDVR